MRASTPSSTKDSWIPSGPTRPIPTGPRCPPLPPGPSIRVCQPQPTSCAPPPMLHQVVGGRRQSFLGDSFRPIGAVIRRLIPSCPRCQAMQRICANEHPPNAPKSNKPKFACKACAAVHHACDCWKAFHIVFDDRVGFENYLFEFWEHIGGGEFMEVDPDPRLADLSALGAHSLLLFLSLLTL